MAEESTLTVERVRTISKTDDLSNIQQLSLSDKSLDYISPELFQQLSSIEELDLSNNNFQSLDLKDVFLPSLVKLNLANNQLTTLNGFTAFPNLSDLNITNNPKIEVSDKYKLVAVCPLLKLLDGKDVSMMREAVSRLDITLVVKVGEVWTSSFEKKFNEFEGKEAEIKLKQEYLEKLKMEVTCGPPILAQYREFRLSILGEQYFQKKIDNKEKEEEDRARKKAKLSENGEVINTSRLVEECKKNYPVIKDNLKEVKKISDPYPADAQFVVSHLLQTHSLNNNPDDRKTQVWGCQFQPDIHHPGKTTSMCATCGGDSVCFIDCSTGQVLKKYKQPGEIFYCIAWTTVTMDINGNKRKANLLAAGGAQMAIKLIEPTQLVCCEEIFGLKGVLESLMFHPVYSSWLICAADDTVTLWDVGLPKGPDFGKKSKLLSTLKCRTIVRSFSIPPHGEVLVGASDDGCYVWRIPDKDIAADKPRSPFGRLEFSGKKSLPLDCVQCLSDNLVATKRIEEGTICVWYSESSMFKNDFTLTLKVPWRKTNLPFLKFSYAPTCQVLVAGDNEGCVWLYDIMRYTPDTEKRDKYEVMEQTQILMCPNESTKVFNQVCSDSALQYIVAVADTNVVCIWRRM